MPFISHANFCRAAVASIVCLLALPIAAGAREFRAADTQADDYPTVQALRFMARQIEEKTGGRHTIRVFHSRQLGEEKETIEQTRVGAIDLNRTNVAPIGSLIPAANVLSLPFLFRSFDHLHKVLDQSIGEEILAGFQRHGFVGLTYYDSGARSIYNSVRPVRTLADMKGLRIRVQQSELMLSMIKALGAEPIELPYGQVLTGLQAKLIDGAENNWPSYVSTDHYKPVGRRPDHLSRRRPQIEHVHARAVGGMGAAVAAAGQGRRQHDHRRYRQTAVRAGHGADPRQAGDGP
jgi:tripartite ATP-independent transporter DctP family solute receptor